MALMDENGSNGGSPPRMRGKQQLRVCFQFFRRITPAYAGKTIIYHRMHSKSRDHPRVCGENLPVKALLLRIQGSPPRMRGKLPFLRFRSLTFRITPAYAGKTCYAHALCPPSWDHPRVCGENPGLRPPPPAVVGSPPRMRGKRRRSFV